MSAQLQVSRNFWQGDLVTLRAVEVEDWIHFFEWNKDTYFERMTNTVSLPRSREAVRKRTADVATYDWILLGLTCEEFDALEVGYATARG
ncbi:MAG: hypothetical protein JXA14_10140 [Anaerolineae bacterium]|nr:hypothetical protein [Anaerolineae bacterium]